MTVIFGTLLSLPSSLLYYLIIIIRCLFSCTGETCIHLACKSGNIALLEFLFNSGADINAQVSDKIKVQRKCKLNFKKSESREESWSQVKETEE